MTYGWALLLMVLIVGALFALGVFDVGSFVGNRAAGFAQIGVVGWRVTPAGAFTLMLKNNVGSDINITSINATLGLSGIMYNTTTTILNGAQSSALNIGTFTGSPTSGSYSLKVNIQYTDTATGFSYTDSGSISGKVA